MQELLKQAATHLEGDLDRDQIELYDLALSQAECNAARALERLAANSNDALLQSLADYLAAETRAEIFGRLNRRPASYGLSHADLAPLAESSEVLSPTAIAVLGERLLSSGLPEQTLNEEQRIIRDTFREFADAVVKPLAEEIHREDKLIPEEILQPLREMGCFGLSVPERFGGLKPDDHEDSVGMVLVTEELSRGSLGAAGSLITRPEIMARAIMEGGTEEQQARWLPDMASGETLVRHLGGPNRTRVRTSPRSVFEPPRRRAVGCSMAARPGARSRVALNPFWCWPHRPRRESAASRTVTVRGQQARARRP